MSHPADERSSSADVGPAADPAGEIPDDPRLFLAVQEYLHELEAGRKPDRQKWLALAPELSDALTQCLDGLDLVYQSMPLAKPGPASPWGPAGEAQPASPLGDFQITREIGRGGMGVVYEAIQLSLGRRVALKILPFAATFDNRQLQRFRHEAQAAAQLHHTNIVPVYAVGCERGIHFYAMQLIEGQSLDIVIRQLRAQAGLGGLETGASRQQSSSSSTATPADEQVDATEAWSAAASSGSPGVPPAQCEPAGTATQSQLSVHFSTQRAGRESAFYRTAVRCMAQAAEALEYAHQQGIIHRDIKPANLLIDVRGSVWLTDFGLAHFHANPGLTQTGDVLGTVRYMSPEQASGQRVVLDHRTDVYSLGATFYELVTLHPLFSSSTRESLLLDVLNRDPQPPRAVDRKIPAELETILLKSLGKNPADRYASAQELADDLHRFLRDEPIRAKRPSLLERVRKWLRRHPAMIAAALLAMLLLLVGSLVSNWLITEANDRTKAALAQEQLRAEEAEKSFRQAREAVNLLIEVSEEELADKPPLQNVRKRLLETALVYYQDFVAQRRDNPSGQAELIAVQQRLKKVLDDLSKLEGAGQLGLLADPRVQADLGLNEDQRARVGAMTEQLVQKRSDSFHDFHHLSTPERRARFLELARANDQAMRAILTPAQLQRLEQINWQIRGPAAFSQSEVAGRLQLTEAQRRAIHQIEVEMYGSMWEHQGRGGKRPAGNLRTIAVRSALDKVLALLTPEQTTEWEKLRGAEFPEAAEVWPHGAWLRHEDRHDDRHEERPDFRPPRMEP
jgi:serine/threonine protein kinase